MSDQLHAGDFTGKSCHPKGIMRKIWHTNSEGKYESGKWHARTPLQLKRECESTLKDLRKNHPKLFGK